MNGNQSLSSVLIYCSLSANSFPIIFSNVSQTAKLLLPAISDSDGLGTAVLVSPDFPPKH